jgi:hypothetical protein
MQSWDGFRALPNDPINYPQPPCGYVRDPWRISYDDNKFGLPQPRRARHGGRATTIGLSPPMNPERKGDRRSGRRPGRLVRM